ncbi:MAG: PTS sugar transporter subunit IIC [Acholeplasmataceae bacterium]|jgi:uncharacterized membrane protein
MSTDNINATNSDNNLTKSKFNNFRSMLMTTLNGMAMGLFATLIIGTIIDQLGILIGDNFVGNFLRIPIANSLKMALGIGIGAGVALSLKLDWLKIIVAALMGLIASSFKLLFVKNPNSIFIPIFGKDLGPIGFNLDPLTIYLVVIIGIWLMRLILKKKTNFDLFIVPLLGVAIAVVLTYLISGPVGFIVHYIALFVDISTKAVPFVMVIVISVVMGMILTAPISSAAVAMLIVIGQNPLAAAAAIIGTSTQMVGFAVQSRKDNKIGTILSVGIGTSMIQFKNILKKPIIWLPTIIASAILAPFVLLFGFETTAQTIDIQSAWTLGAGMGTSGLVGQFSTINALGIGNYKAWLFIIFLQIIGPIILVYAIDFLFRKFNLIQEGDLEV